MSGTKSAEAVGKIAGDLQAVGEAVRQTGQQAREAGAAALEQARHVAQESKAHAMSTLGALGEQAELVAETQKANLAERIEDAAKAIHKSGEQLEGHQDWIAKLVEQGADELSAIATTLRSNDLQNLLGDLGSLARRQPGLFVGASMAAGFVLARVGRVAISSSSTRDNASSPTQSAPGEGSPYGSTQSPAAPPSATMPGSTPASGGEGGGS